MKKYIFITLLLVFNTVFSQNTENVVGTISGRVDVTPTGGASYTIPIEVPPGTKGLQPNISLVYNSQSGVGIAGKGWNISGLSSIRRKGKSIYHNNKVEGIKFDDTDNFIYDGMTLVPFAGENGQENTEYRTEIESYIKCYSLGRIGNSPAYFTVETKDGSKIYYGTDNSTGNIASRSEGLYWNISKIIDEYGNYMTFSYDNNSSTTGDFLISEINYTGNISLGQAPYNKIVFEYEDYTGFAAYYFDGVKYQNTKRLKYIKTYAEGQLVKTYDIIYSNNTSNTQFSISEIKEINYLGEELNSTKFSWDVSDHEYRINYNPSSISTLLYYTFFNNGYAPECNKSNMKIHFGDIDGDGDKDIIVLGTDSYASNKSDYYDDERSLGIYVFIHQDDGGFTRQKGTWDNDSEIGFQQSEIRDIMIYDKDRDGKDDILIIRKDNILFATYNIDTKNFTIISQTPLSDEFVPLDNQGYIKDDERYGYSFADVNGDGILDLLEIFQEGVYYWLGSLSGFSSNRESIQLYHDVLRILDVYGESQNTIFPARFLFGDVNGDGMADLITFSYSANFIILPESQEPLIIDQNNNVKVYLSNGNGFDEPTVWTNNTDIATLGLEKRNDIQLVDINGDGLADLVGTGENFSRVYLSTGGNFENTPSYGRMVFTCIPLALYRL
ncbi:MAG: SpvB/TcaC N-terminal domain-containing protein [Bacteroidales bacterium]